MLFSNTVKHLVLERQCFVQKADRIRYNELFSFMSPVQTPYWSRPGNPPELVYRAGFPEYQHVFDMRSRRIIVKGRFQGGNIAYIFADELPLFASVYSRDRRSLTPGEIEILELLEQEGPMTILAIKEITGHLTKHITPVLHKLQQKFLVFEDQADNEWDRAWYLFESEFPDVNLDLYPRDEAVKTLILRFAFLNVFITGEMVGSFYRLKTGEISDILTELEKEGVIQKQTLDGVSGYIRTEDLPLLESKIIPIKSVYILHRNDFLVKSHETYLQKSFRHDKYSILYYILLDGEFRGFIAGFFKNTTPFIIEDIIIKLSPQEANERKKEIIEAVGLVIDTDISPVKRYCGNKFIP